MNNNSYLRLQFLNFFSDDYNIVTPQELQQWINVINECKLEIKEILDQFYERNNFENITSIEYIVSDFLLDIWVGELKKQGLFESLINSCLTNLLNERFENLKDKLKCKSNKELDNIFLLILKTLYEEYLKNKLNSEKIDEIILYNFQFLLKDIPEMQKFININLIPELRKLLKYIEVDQLKLTPRKEALETLLSNIELTTNYLLENFYRELHSTECLINELYEKVQQNYISNEEKERIKAKLTVLSKKIEVLNEFNENKGLFEAILKLISNIKLELERVENKSTHELVKLVLFELTLLELIDLHKNKLESMFLKVENIINSEIYFISKNYLISILQLYHLILSLRKTLIGIKNQLQYLVKFPSFEDLEKTINKSLIEILSETIYEALKTRNINNPIKFKQEFPKTCNFINYISGIRGEFYNKLPGILDKMGIKNDLQPLLFIEKKKIKIKKDKKPKITVKSPKDIIFG